MKLLTQSDAFRELCRATGKWGILLGIDGEANWTQIYLAAPYLRDTDDHFYQMMSDQIGFILCDDKEECRRLYDQTVGDDGPTESNPYDGPTRVYALTCDPTGQLQNENT